MYVRLAFAVAAHLEPEILLVDEVLAVGDAAFQKKCLGKMGEVSREGRTVLFVSHNMAAVRNLCDQAVLLEGGRVLAKGYTNDTISTYLERDTHRQRPDDLALRKDRKGSGIIRCKSVSFHRQGHGTTRTFLSGDHLAIHLRYSASQRLPDSRRMLVGVSIKDMYDQVLFLCSNELTDEITRGWPEDGELVCAIPRLPLSAGSYKANVYFAVNGVVADWVVDAASFDVERGDFFGTGRMPIPSHERFLVRHSWAFGHREDSLEDD
jgi:lipopolysaccharide transport system ATP-binding protein